MKLTITISSVRGVLTELSADEPLPAVRMYDKAKLLIQEWFDNAGNEAHRWTNITVSLSRKVPPT